MGSFITVSIVQEAVSLGFIYALVTLALFLSYTILNIADLSTDGCFTLGCAICCQVTLMGHPFLGLLAAMLAGVCSGFITAFLQTRLGVESILAGIVVNTGLYTINIAAMGFSTTLNLIKTNTVFSLFADTFGQMGGWYRLIIVAALAIAACLLMALFLRTRLGLSIRATGDNPDMVRASSINPAFTITVGLCVANSFTALAGGILAQYQKSCDINLGTGMVTIALASLIIGETILGAGRHSGVGRHLAGVLVGSCLYRFIVALALRLNMPAACLKLVSAVIVAIAISMPSLKKAIAFQKRKMGSRAAKGGKTDA